MELTPETADAKARYKKIVAYHAAVDRLFVDVFLTAHPQALFRTAVSWENWICIRRTGTDNVLARSGLLIVISQYADQKRAGLGFAPFETVRFPPNGGSLLKDAFLFARAFVSEHGFSNEIEWQDSVSLEDLTEESFLQEYAWVVLASGMREAIVRRKFPSISECFFFWSSAKQIADQADTCVRAALQVFHHEPKMRAIAFTAGLIAKESFPVFKRALEAQPVDKLLRLPYIGPITQYHLAKNIGFNIAKPDRHLVRIAQLFGYPSVQDFCGAASSQTGAKAAVVDLVFWRFATLRKDYLEVFGRFAPVTEQSQSNRPS